MAYAAISSLIYTLEQLLKPNQSLLCQSCTQQHLQSLCQNLSALQDFLDNTTKDIETLKVVEKRIRNVVYKAEYRVDSSLRRIFLADREDKRQKACTSFYEELLKVEQQVYFLKKLVMLIEFSMHGSKSAELATTSSSPEKNKIEENTIVGMQDDFNTILDRVTSQIGELTGVPIFGMGGIGKTTLARKVYDDSSIRSRSNKHAWVTISQEYIKRQMLLEVVSSITGSNQEMSDDELMEIVYRGLKEMGKHIVEQCQGLPLSIIVVAGLLRKMDPTHDNWKEVEENLNSFFGTVSERCQSILSLSYNYLPQYLKACFLYVGGFQEDREINVSKLIRLWISEQFVKARKNKRLEVVAGEYVKELIDRSLILIGQQRANGRMRNCKIHDLLRQMCLSEAHTENVLHVMNGDALKAIDDQRRVIQISTTEIPESIGEIMTLKLIQIVDCSSAVENSAKRIRKEQQSFGNYELQVQITPMFIPVFECFANNVCSWDYKPLRNRETVKVPLVGRMTEVSRRASMLLTHALMEFGKDPSMQSAVHWL
ncbi:hypothetical protein KY289_009477 [Solanum tuberosum]|nr:hypothetical protein KY289_009477 [Solanum tuberosum]